MLTDTLRLPKRAHGVLVADDDADVREVLNVSLLREGFSVWLAADGHEALDVYRDFSETIDVALLDVRMPGLDGPRTLAALRETNPQIRCCFMTGDLGSYTEQRLYRLGADVVFTKPFRLSDVAQVLRALAQLANSGPAPCSAQRLFPRALRRPLTRGRIGRLRETDGSCVRGGRALE
jgi:CheY-like chemotaxis protein